MPDPTTVTVTDRVAVSIGGGPQGASGTWGSIVGTLANQTDLQAALDLKFDTADIPTLAAPAGNLSGTTLKSTVVNSSLTSLGTLNHLKLSTAPTGVPTTEGTLSWDGTDKTLTLQTEISDVRVQVGQETMVRVRNSTGGDLPNGTVVYVTGSSGQRVSVAKAIATNANHVKSVIGVVTADIAHNSNGYVTLSGLARDIDVGSANDGDVIYLSDSAAGEFTTTMPTGTTTVYRVGWVTDASQGTILVHPERLTVLSTEISDSTTVGRSLVTVANPSAITFPRVNADNTVTLRSAANFRTDLGLGTTDAVTFGVVTAAGLLLSDTVWDDLRISSGGFEIAGTSDPTQVDWQPGGSGGTLKVWEFDKNDQVFVSAQMPHKYKPDTNLQVHVHWTPREYGVAQRNNTVGWKVDITAANYNAAFPATTTLDLSHAVPADCPDHAHLITSSATFTVPSGFKESGMVLMRVYRSDTGTDDTWSETLTGRLPILLEVDIHFQINKLGSSNEAPD